MSDRCFNYKNRTIKTHILIVYYNFVKMTASPRIQTQGDSIPVEHTNHSPKSLGRLINTTYVIIRQFA